jgi:hypothetical protein
MLIHPSSWNRNSANFAFWAFSEVAPALPTLHTERVDRHGGAKGLAPPSLGKGEPMSPQARDHSFDQLARGLASGSISRGRALRLMGAALVGGALGSLGIGEAGADPPGCKRNGKACKKDEQCCSGNCVNGTCACKGLFSGCNNNSECCSGYCNQFGTCDQNLVTCRCQDGFVNPSLCTTTQACGDTTALNQFCNSYCTRVERGSGVAVECSQGGCGN